MRCLIKEKQEHNLSQIHNHISAASPIFTSVSDYGSSTILLCTCIMPKTLANRLCNFLAFHAFTLFPQQREKDIFSLLPLKYLTVLTLSSCVASSSHTNTV